MRRLPLILGQVALLVALAACSDKLNHIHSGDTSAADAKRHKLQHKLMHRLAKQLEGNYASTTLADIGADAETGKLRPGISPTIVPAQAAEPDYHDLRLHVKRIWKNRSEAEGLYFYAELAPAADPLHPVRQQVYCFHLRSEDDKIENLIYGLRGPKRLVGQWKEKEPLSGLNPDSLVQLRGCALVMVQNNTSATGGFRGVTDGQTCTSNLNGAAYTTLDMSVMPAELIYWERGFDVAGRLLWGPPLGGYVFKKELKKAPKSSDAPTPTKA